MHHLTLYISKLRIKKETVSQEHGQSQVKSQSMLERELEREIKKREEELERIKKDIERVEAYKAVSGDSEDANDLSKDLRTVKAFIREAVEGNILNQVPTSANDDLNELAVIVPKELDRVEARRAKLGVELKSMQNLLEIVGADMVAGI